MRHTTRMAVLAAAAAVFPAVARADTTNFFSPTQVATPVSSGTTSDTISCDGFQFTYTLDKLFTGGYGMTEPIGRPISVAWPTGIDAQAVTSGPTVSGARLTIKRVDNAAFDLKEITFKLLANTAGAGATMEIMPTLANGEDGMQNGVFLNAIGIAGNSFNYNDTSNPYYQGTTALLKGFYSYKIGLYVDFAVTALTLVTPDIVRYWTNAGGTGRWSSVGNWDSGKPNSAGVAATFDTTVTDYGGGTNAGLINVDSAVTIGKLNLDHPSGYTFSGSAIAFDNSTHSGNAAINVLSGNHTLNCPVNLASHLDIDVPDLQTLNLAGAINNAAGKTMTKTGWGTLNITGAQTHGAGAVLAVGTSPSGTNLYGGTVNVHQDLGTNATVVAEQGVVNFHASQRLAALSIRGGSQVNMAANKGYIVTSALAVEPYAGTLDLGNGQLIVKGGDIGAWDAAGVAYTGITGLVMSGQAYAAGYGQWNGAGIISSAAAADPAHNTGVSVVTFAAASANGNPFITQNADGSFSYNVNHDGSVIVTVNGSDVLVRAGWVGDLNADGIINYNDYGMIDKAYLLQLTSAGTSVPAFANGDINGDGVIDYNDYGMLDKAYLAYLLSGNAPMPVAPAATAPVPEPHMLGLAAIVGMATLLRRRI